MTFQTMGHPATSCRGVSLTLIVSSLDGLHSVNLPNVFSIENIPINPNVIPAKGVLNTMPHLSGITFQRIPDATVTLLIGADVPEVFCPIDVRKGGRGQPIVFKSILGWSLLGQSLSSSRSSNCSVNFIAHSEKGKEIEQLVQTLWSTAVAYAGFSKGGEARKFEIYEVQNENFLAQNQVRFSAQN